MAPLTPFCFKHFYANFLTVVNKLTLFKIKKAAPFFETASLNVIKGISYLLTFIFPVAITLLFLSFTE